MTEDEAKSRWCPFARVAVATVETDGYAIHGHVTSYNRLEARLGSGTTVIPHAGYCIASACMAWRTMPTLLEEDSFGGRITRYLRDGMKISAIKEWRQEYGATLKDAKDAVEEIVAGTRPIPGSPSKSGYCGAAGMPR